MQILREKQDPDPWNDYRVNRCKVSGGAQSTLKQHKLNHSPSVTHTHTHTRIPPHLCAAAVKRHQTNWVECRNLHPQLCLMHCNQNACTGLLHPGLFTFRIRRVQKSGCLQVWDQGINLISENRLFSQMTLPEQLAEDSSNKAKTLPLFSEMDTNEILSYQFMP